MKKLLLAAVMLASALSIHAQMNVLVKDSVYINEGGQSIISISAFSYDANCRLSIAQYYSVDSATQVQTNVQELDYDYYADGTKYHIITKLWNPFTSSYLNISRETFTYTANKYVATDMTESWTGTAWVNSSLVTYTYTAGNKIETYLSQSWKGAAWVNDNLESYTYTASNKIITYLAQSWVKNAWQDDSLTTNTYDAGDRITNTMNEIRNKNQCH